MHGIFCLETDWWGVKDRTTVEPVLALLERRLRVPYIRRTIGTREEFQHYVRKWTQQGLAPFPILYLAFHGEPGILYVGEKRGAGKELSIQTLGEMLAGKCKRQIIHFGACETVGVHGNTLNAFLAETQALAVMGYREAVDWVESAAFDLLLLGSLQDVTMTKQGVGKLRRLMKERAATLSKRLGFVIKTTP